MENSNSNSNSKPGRGRPRTRFAPRDEQIRQNMRLYRARRAAELEALSRVFERLAEAVAGGDVQATFLAAASAAGLWSESSLRDNVIKNRGRRRQASTGSA